MELHAQIACALPDKVEIIDAGDLAELAYYRTILRCRENLTDGVIDRRRVPRWYAGIRGKPATHLNRLRDVGLLIDHPDGWAIPPDVWRRWNPTKAEVEAKRAAETNRKRRWKEQRHPDGGDATATSSRRGRDERRDAQPEPEPEPEPYTSSSVSTVEAPAADDDDRFNRTLDLVVDAKIADAKPHSPNAYRMVTRTNTLAEDGELIRRMLADGDAPETVALFVLGHGLTTDAARSTTNAIPWCGPDCSTCNGDAFVDTGDGRLAPCPARTSVGVQPAGEELDQLLAGRSPDQRRDLASAWAAARSGR